MGDLFLAESGGKTTDSDVSENPTQHFDTRMLVNPRNNATQAFNAVDESTLTSCKAYGSHCSLSPCSDPYVCNTTNECCSHFCQRWTATAGECTDCPAWAQPCKPH